MRLKYWYPPCPVLGSHTYASRPPLISSTRAWFAATHAQRRRMPSLAMGSTMMSRVSSMEAEGPTVRVMVRPAVPSSSSKGLVGARSSAPSTASR